MSSLSLEQILHRNNTPKFGQGESLQHKIFTHDNAKNKFIYQVKLSHPSRPERMNYSVLTNRGKMSKTAQCP